MRKKKYLVEGLNISSRLKILLTITLFVIALLNFVLPPLLSFDYPGKGIVSIALLFLGVIFSFGNKTAEFIVLGISVFMIVNGIYDFASTLSFSDVKVHLFIVMIAVTIAELAFGKVSITNLILILKRSGGVK